MRAAWLLHYRRQAEKGYHGRDDEEDAGDDVVMKALTYPGADEKEKPAEEKEADEKEKPADEKEADEKEKPADEREKPADEKEKPAEEKEADEKPADEKVFDVDALVAVHAQASCTCTRFAAETPASVEKPGHAWGLVPIQNIEISEKNDPIEILDDGPEWILPPDDVEKEKDKHPGDVEAMHLDGIKTDC